MGSVFLVGFMGSGKSTVGQRLAGRLEMPFVDMDAQLEQRVGCTIAELFARQGEAAFRRLETELLDELSRGPASVVATGGGCFCSERNQRIIRDSGGESVLLDLPWSVLEQRLGQGWDGERPLLGNPAATRQLLASREPEYRKASIIVDLEGSEDVSEVVERLLRVLQEVRCAT